MKEAIVGHMHSDEQDYALLQRRLDQTVTGAPDSPALRQLLQLLFPPETVELATNIPTRFVTIEKLSKKMSVPVQQLHDQVNAMAERGLVMDVSLNEKRYIALAPVVIGFYEFTLMRTRDTIPMQEIARLFDEYMKEDKSFTHSLFDADTQVCRSLVREEAISEVDHTEILDWERASQVIKSASQIAVGLCSCRHKAYHLGSACDAPLETCLTFNEAAKMLIRNNIARPLDTKEALDLLTDCKRAGLAQTADNVQKEITYMCNCCGCCCHFFDAVKRFGIRNAVVTSNWIAKVDWTTCRGCGKCVEACPVNAIYLAGKQSAGEEKFQAIADEDLCLGCGVCYSHCRFGAIRLEARPQRVLTPRTMFDRIVLMAIERGKLADLLFEEPEKVGIRAMKRLVHALEHSSLFQATMAVKPLRSVFLNTIVAMAKRDAGEMGKVFG